MFCEVVIPLPFVFHHLRLKICLVNPSWILFGFVKCFLCFFPRPPSFPFQFFHWQTHWRVDLPQSEIFCRWLYVGVQISAYNQLHYSLYLPSHPLQSPWFHNHYHPQMRRDCVRRDCEPYWIWFLGYFSPVTMEATKVKTNKSIFLSFVEKNSHKWSPKSTFNLSNLIVISDFRSGNKGWVYQNKIEKYRVHNCTGWPVECVAVGHPSNIILQSALSWRHSRVPLLHSGDKEIMMHQWGRLDTNRILLRHSERHPKPPNRGFGMKS